MKYILPHNKQNKTNIEIACYDIQNGDEINANFCVCLTHNTTNKRCINENT